MRFIQFIILHTWIADREYRDQFDLHGIRAAAHYKELFLYSFFDVSRHEIQLIQEVFESQ